jgi:hypothetical protein
MQNGHWRKPGFPKSGWVVLRPKIDLGRRAQLCGMCWSSVYRYIVHVEHFGPPHRCLDVGEDCALALTGGDMRTRAEREGDTERRQIEHNRLEFQRAIDTPWNYGTFARYGWAMSKRGNPWRRLACGKVTLFPRDGGWKACWELGTGPEFLPDVYPDEKTARRTAYEYLLWHFDGRPSTVRPIQLNRVTAKSRP